LDLFARQNAKSGKELSDHLIERIPRPDMMVHPYNPSTQEAEA
jgi:hypothetical protein